MRSDVKPHAHINLLLTSFGVHWGAWRHPATVDDANTSISHYSALAQAAEKVKIDSVFMADVPVLLDNRLRPLDCLEPTVVLAALALLTERIGLIGTVSTTYNDPYNVARRLASLDHISNGRAGWNIVTTCVNAGPNFSMADGPGHSDRYIRAAEFAKVCLDLWGSWQADAVVADRTTGVYADPALIRRIDHKGAYFSVRGPSQLPRSPQGHPVLVQAGSSEDGRNFAAGIAEIIFAGQSSLAEARSFYSDMKGRALRAGRDPGRVKILPGLVTLVGGTEEEAKRRQEELEALVVDDYALQRLALMLEVPVERLDLDRGLPDDLPSPRNVVGSHGRYSMIVDRARRERLTVRQLLPMIGSGGGHQLLAGTPEQIADVMEHWLGTGAADGFTVMPAVTMVDVEAFTTAVMPELQRRGLVRSDYTGKTLRDHYGLSSDVS